MTRFAVIGATAGIHPLVAMAGGTITSLGPVQGQNVSGGLALTADGSVVVGFSGSQFPGRHATRWAGANWAPQDLGTAQGQSDGILYGAADSGNAAFGWAQVASNFVPFRWTTQAGIQNLPTPWNSSRARAIAPDGSFIVGEARPGNFTVPIRWNGINAPTQLPLPQGALSGRAMVATRSGNILGSVGAAGTQQLVRWNSVNNAVSTITNFAPNVDGAPFAASADESVIAGIRTSLNQPLVSLPWRWTADEGFEDLPLLAGFVSGNVWSSSADGSVLVGDMYDANFTNYRGVVWTDSGVQSVESYLTGFGVDMSGWTIGTCHGISQDGMTLVGVGLNPVGQTRGWVAVIPAPATAALLAIGVGVTARRRRM